MAKGRQKTQKKEKKKRYGYLEGKKGNIMRIVVKKGKHEYFVGNRETWYKRKKVSKEDTNDE